VSGAASGPAGAVLLGAAQGWEISEDWVSWAFPGLSQSIGDVAGAADQVGVLVTGDVVFNFRNQPIPEVVRPY
jgi:hypothetical protein